MTNTHYNSREFFFDNARWLLMLLVVVGHMSEPHSTDNAVYSVYFFLYLFHMPAFAFISGRFSKSTFNSDYLVKITARLIVPYIIFQSLYSILLHIIKGSPELSISLDTPIHLMWYLLSLACWRLMLPLFSMLQFPILTSIAIGLLVGYSDDFGIPYSLSRTFVFFPFFVLGNRLSYEKLRVLFHPIIRIAGLLILLTALIASFKFSKDIGVAALYGKHSYAELNWNENLPSLNRMALYLVSLVTGAAFLSLVPRGKTVITPMGQGTIYSYLLHFLPIYLYRQSSLNEKLLAQFSSWYIVGITIGAALVLHIVLSSKWFQWGFRFFIEPSKEKLGRYIIAGTIISFVAIHIHSLTHPNSKWLGEGTSVTPKLVENSTCTHETCATIPNDGLFIKMTKPRKITKLNLSLSGAQKYHIHFYRTNRLYGRRQVHSPYPIKNEQTIVKVSIPRRARQKGIDLIHIIPIDPNPEIYFGELSFQ